LRASLAELRPLWFCATCAVMAFTCSTPDVRHPKG
jgi:hypothetical protein